MPIIDCNIFHITDRDSFIIDEKSPLLPVDKNSIPVRVGDLLLLHHNKKLFQVNIMQYCGDGTWLVFGKCSGGGFMLPESRENVTHVHEA